MNQGKLEVVRHEMARVNTDILGLSKLKWAGMGEFNSDDHYIYKTSGGDGIPVELSQILKDDAVKVLHSICQQIWKTQQCHTGLQKFSFIPIPKKGNAKECSTAATAKSLLSCLTLCDPINGNPPVSPSLGFSRQEHWSGLPFPSPMQESEK